MARQPIPDCCKCCQATTDNTCSSSSTSSTKMSSKCSVTAASCCSSNNSRAPMLQLLSLLLLLLLHCCMAAREAAVWIDDGNGHTVKEPLSPRESREFSQKLRETMGLPDHRPHFSIRRINEVASASTFMKTIYSTLDELGIPQDPSLDPAHREALEKADTIVTFTSKAPPHRGDEPPPKHHAPHRLLYFDTSEVSLDHTLLSAELRVHHLPRRPEYSDAHLDEILDGAKVLHVYIVTDAVGGELEVAQIPLTAANETEEVEGRWLQLNVTAPALAWLLEPTENRGFRLAVVTEGYKREHNLHSTGISTSHDRVEFRPILVCFMTRPQTVIPQAMKSPSPAPVSHLSEHDLLSRAVRSLPNNRRPGWGTPAVMSDNEMSCKLRPLHVSFADLNWQQWVIGPDGYDANFCQGRCAFPMPAEMNATNHAIVQTLITVLHAVREGERIPPAACCTPKDLATISVLYYDYSNNVVLKKYPKMIVKNCACT